MKKIVAIMFLCSTGITLYPMAQPRAAVIIDDALEHEEATDIEKVKTLVKEHPDLAELAKSYMLFSRRDRAFVCAQNTLGNAEAIQRLKPCINLVGSKMTEIIDMILPELTKSYGDIGWFRVVEIVREMAKSAGMVDMCEYDRGLSASQILQEYAQRCESIIRKLNEAKEKGIFVTEMEALGEKIILAADTLGILKRRFPREAKNIESIDADWRRLPNAQERKQKLIEILKRSVNPPWNQEGLTYVDVRAKSESEIEEIAEKCVI